MIAGIVGYADLRLASKAGVTLDALAEAADGLLVGIRHSTAWDNDPGVPVHRQRPAPGLMASPAWRSGFREIARRSLVFDAWVYHPQLPEVEELASAFSDTPIVIGHLGGLLRVGRYQGLEQALAEARISLARLSRLPNVYLKIGGIGMTNIGREWDRPQSPSSDDLAATWGPYIRWCIEQFGPSRCMFESNFPVDRETCSYAVLWNAYKLMVTGASASEKSALFAATARSFYSLPATAVTAVRNG